MAKAKFYLKRLLPGIMGKFTASSDKLPTSPQEPNQSFANDRHRLYLLWFLQGIVLMGGTGICIELGTSPWFWATGSTVYSVFLVWLGWHLWKETHSLQSLATRGVLFRIMQVGVYGTPLGLVAFAYARALRINWHTSAVTGTLLLFSLGLLAFLVLYHGRYAIKNQSTPWPQFAAGLTLIPLLSAWLAASVASAWLKPRLTASVTAVSLDKIRTAELAKRAAWVAHSKGWHTPEKKPIRIAVALSGGGYRAAVVHAGLLQALDEHCLPIHLLSTVSGGSIIGTHYALGYPPSLFKQRLMDQRPGLADTLFAIWNVLRDWFGPDWTSADTYAQHFSRTFFGTNTLADTSDLPRLLVNATDIEVTHKQREVFFKGRDRNYPELDQTLLADIVAASGAFPGAFQPKNIRWMGSGSPHTRRFVDGGVVENLGFTGLIRFLAEVHSSRDQYTLLIISDASAGITQGALPRKAGLIELLTRSADISYAYEHEFLLQRMKIVALRGMPLKLLVIKAHGKDAEDILGHFLFQPTTTGNVIAQEVASYPTLKELEAHEVEKAFWVGHTLGQSYWISISDNLNEVGATELGCQKM